MMKKIGFTISLFILGLPSFSQACSCMAPAVEDLWPFADVIFIGKAKSEMNWLSRSSRRTVFHVDEHFKEDYGKNVSVWTLKDEARCGMSFQMEKTYIVFAKKDRIWLESGLCSAIPEGFVDEGFLKTLKQKAAEKAL